MSRFTATAARVDHLGHVPLFSACSKKELQALVRLGRDVTVPAGATVIRQGELSTDCFVILDGSVSVEIDGTAVATLGVGECFGELAPLDHRPRSATVTALTESTFFVLDDKEFAEAVATIPGLTRKVLASLSTRVRESNVAVGVGR